MNPNSNRMNEDQLQFESNSQLEKQQNFSCAVSIIQKHEQENSISESFIGLANEIKEGPKQAEKKQAEKKQAEKKQAEKKQAEKKQAEKKQAEKKQAEKKQAEKKQTWSPHFKSKAIEINGNIIESKSKDSFAQFALMNIDFTKQNKTSYLWVIRIIKKVKYISLGICLKNKICQYKFSSHNIQWNKLRHGFYLISSLGSSLSHSSSQFNLIHKGFAFDAGDEILVEYDPLNLKLRFMKNYQETFEMPIEAPPENYCYCPCVGINNCPKLFQFGKNYGSVQLLTQ